MPFLILFTLTNASRANYIEQALSARGFLVYRCQLVTRRALYEYCHKFCRVKVIFKGSVGGSKIAREGRRATRGKAAAYFVSYLNIFATRYAAFSNQVDRNNIGLRG